MNRRTFLSSLSAIPAAMAQPAATAASDDWPLWRGPFHNGVARSSAPLAWSDSKGIAWKAGVPGRGFSSPVLWGDRIFLTTAVPAGPPPPASEPGPNARAGGGSGPLQPHRFVVLCYDRLNGKLLWEQTATEATPHEGYHNKYGSFASNSPVTDGKHIYASFGSRGLYAYDLAGKLVWKKDFGVKMRIHNAFGEGIAPVLEGNTLLALFDHNDEGFLAALDKDSGKELWRTVRAEGTNWAQPLVVTHDGRRKIIVPSSGKTRCYEFSDGKLLWECAGLGSNTIPHPVFHDGLAIVMSGHRNPNMLAIRMGRSGDLTGSDAIAWTNQRGNPYTPAPVLHDGKLYVITDSGQASCFNPATGQAFYQQQRLPKPYNFKASPVAASGRIYFSSEEGDVIVCSLGEKFDVLATNTLADEFFVATPAVARGHLYLRGRNTLYAIAG